MQEPGPSVRNAGRTAETIEKSRRLSLAAQLLAQLLIFHVGLLQRSVSGFQVTLELIDQLDELPLGPLVEASIRVIAGLGRA